MPAHRGGAAPAYALKTICLFPDNPTRGLDAHQGTVTLFSGETGEVRALMNASAITAIRTAAVSGVATRLLAREDARELAIVGAGVQARSHVEAMRERAAVRPDPDREPHARARAGAGGRRPAPRRSRPSRRPCAAPTSSSRRRTRRSRSLRASG